MIDYNIPIGIDRTGAKQGAKEVTDSLNSVKRAASEDRAEFTHDRRIARTFG